MLDAEQKLGEYEGMAVSVVNTLHNDQVRAENSKTVIESFPSVRLTSEKAKKVEGRGRNFLPSLLLTTIIGAGCFGLGYNIRTSRENTKRVEKSIEELIKKDLESNQGFAFSGDIDFFAEMYGLRLLKLQTQPYTTYVVKKYFKNYTNPRSPNTIIYKTVEGGTK